MTYMKFTILVHPPLVIITIAYTKFVWSMSGSIEKKIVKKIM